MAGGIRGGSCNSCREFRTRLFDSFPVETLSGQGLERETETETEIERDRGKGMRISGPCREELGADLLA